MRLTRPMPPTPRPTPDAAIPRFASVLGRLDPRHPSQRALERYHAREDAPAARTRVARHVIACRTCHAWLAWRDALRGAAHALGTEAVAPSVVSADADPAGLAGALRRRAVGERVLLPTEEPVGRPTGTLAAPRFVPRYAATRAVGLAAAAALVAAYLARPTRRADAGTVAGELEISPASPRAGDTLVVRYRPGVTLTGAPVLRLRAAYHPGDDVRPSSRLVRTVASLVPGTDDSYHARVVLPPDVAYAEFAVEDPLARHVDAHGGEPWDVIVGDAASRPRMDAIRTQGMSAAGGAWERTRAVALEATRLYPDHPSGWWVRTQQDAELAGAARQDSVAAAARPLVARLDPVLARAPRRESWAMLDLSHLAAFAGVPEVEARWRTRLLDEAPHSVAAYTERVAGLWAAHAPPRAQLDSLERWWAVDGDSLSLFFAQSVGLAVTAHDAAAARRWAARAVTTDAASTLFVAQQLAHDPALASDALRYARSVVARVGDTDGADRPLDATTDAWARVREGRRRAAQAVEGAALLALGHGREAVGALVQATAAGWDVDALRQLGEAHLALGDTTAALRAFADAAADPVLGARLTHALTTRLGPRVVDPGWTRQVDAARHVMSRRLRGRPRIGADPDGPAARRRRRPARAPLVPRRGPRDARRAHEQPVRPGARRRARGRTGAEHLSRPSGRGGRGHARPARLRREHRAARSRVARAALVRRRGRGRVRARRARHAHVRGTRHRRRGTLAWAPLA